jgi:hypothetical protein
VIAYALRDWRKLQVKATIFSANPRVTRLGEFSPYWAIVFFGQLSKLTEVAQIFWGYFYLAVKVMYQY